MDRGDGCWAGMTGSLGLVSGVSTIGSRGWVQHLPWLTQRVQKPHSPSLQGSHFQKQSLQNAKQFEQKLPAWRRLVGSSDVTNGLFPSESDN